MKTDQQMQAQRMYLQEGKSQTDIAQKLGTDRKTIYNWIKTGAWEEMKSARGQTPAAMVQYIYGYIEAIHSRIANRKLNNAVPYPEEVSSLFRLMTMAKSYEHINIGIYVQAYDELLKLIGGQNEALALTITEFTESIIKSKIPENAFITTEQDHGAPETNNSPSALTIGDIASSTGKERGATMKQLLDNQGLSI